MAPPAPVTLATLEPQDPKIFNAARGDLHFAQTIARMLNRELVRLIGYEAGEFEIAVIIGRGPQHFGAAAQRDLDPGRGLVRLIGQHDLARHKALRQIAVPDPWLRPQLRPEFLERAGRYLLSHDAARIAEVAKYQRLRRADLDATRLLPALI